MTKAFLSALLTAGLIAYVGLMSWSWAAERHYLRGEEEEQAGRFAPAAAEYEAARDMLPACAEYQRAVGRASLAQYNAEAKTGHADPRPLYRARDAHQKAREADPLYPYHDFELGLVLFTMRKAGIDDQPSPEPAFQRALALDPGNPRFLSGWVRWESSQGRADEAWSSFVKLARLHPKTIPDFAPDMLHGDTDYQRFGDELGDAAEANLIFAGYLFDRKRPDLAEQRVLRVPPEAWAAEDKALLVAGIFLARGRVEDAENVLRRATVKTPSNPSLWAQFGALLVRERKFADAVEAYQRALGFHPENQTIRLNHAQAAELAGRPELALQSYREALNLADLNSAQRKDIYLRMGKINEDRGDLTAALGAYRQARELDPDNRELALKIDVLEYKAGRAKPESP